MVIHLRRRVLAASAVVLVGIGAFLVGDVASAIAQSGRTGGVTMRTGTVVELNGATLTVDVGGGQQTAMPYLAQYKPILGDSVQILSQNGTPIVLGRAAGMPPDNAVANPSFEADAPGTTSGSITGWTFSSDPSSTTTPSIKVDTASSWGPVDGSMWLEYNQFTAGISVTYAHSSPIPVQAGQAWTAAASVIMVKDPDGGDPGQMSVWLTWYANSTDTYPSTVASDSQIQLIHSPIGSPADWTLLRAFDGSGIAVPAGANYMRVMLKTVIPQGGSAYWDAVIGRQVG